MHGTTRRNRAIGRRGSGGDLVPAPPQPLLDMAPLERPGLLAKRLDGAGAAHHPVNASSDIVRQSARCTHGGGKGATVTHPSWGGSNFGFAALQMH
jgi:hypothetical protein